MTRVLSWGPNPKPVPVESVTRPPLPAPCDACGFITAATERIRRDGIDLVVCIGEGPCIKRAKAAGRWPL